MENHTQLSSQSSDSGSEAHILVQNFAGAEDVEEEIGVAEMSAKRAERRMRDFMLSD